MAQLTELVAFIPTRNRHELLTKVLPKWDQHREVSTLVIVVEKWEYGRTVQLVKQWPNVEVMRLPKSNQGVTYARKQIVDLAYKQGLDKIIVCDDDLYPHVEDDLWELTLPLGALPTVGVGAMMSFYGLAFGNDLLKTATEPLFLVNALGKRLFSLDVGAVIDIGNYDERLHTFGGDNEIVRVAMREKAYTWYVHPLVRGVSIESRHAPGGIADFCLGRPSVREQRTLECHELMFARWGPRYISTPRLGGRFACNWKNMLNDFVPNWEGRKNWQKS